MNLSQEFLERSSAETGFQGSALEKVARLGELAGDISRHPLLGEVLALKGGTALNLCFGAPMRLSIDLDFNYIGQAAREAMIAQRPIVREAILDLIGRLKYHPQESAEGFSGGKIFLPYRSVAGTMDRIELDLNFLCRVPFSGTSMERLWQPGELDQPAIRMVGLPELLIGKLLAFLDRIAVRDAWDAANLPAPVKAIVGSESFRKLFIAFSAILPHPLSTYTRARLEKSVTEKAIADHLAPTLVTDANVSAKDLITAAWAVIDPLLQLRPEEKEYLATIEGGEARTELLFPDDTEQAIRIGTHPAIEWKLKNVRDFRSRTH
jgi:predicted nucleotidyltransferase component of viral defense system